MKTVSRIALPLLAGMTLLLSSCSKEKPQQFQYQATFYVGGNVAKDGAYIYKGNDLLYKLEEKYAAVSGLALTEKGLFAVGGIYDWDAKPYPAETPLIWKDGKRMDMGFGDAGGWLGSIQKRGSDWFCCGYLEDEEGHSHGIIIKNGEILFRSEEEAEFQHMGISTSGNCYVTGRNADGVVLWQIDQYTKEIVSKESIVPNADDAFWSAACMNVGVGSIAVGLWKIDYSSPDIDRAYIWRSGTKELRDLKEGSFIWDLCFFNGYYIAGGKVAAAESGASPSTKAAQWVNGDGPADLSAGCTGNSETRLLMNYDDLFLFQAVQHEGGVRICNNGALLRELKAVAGFNATCWDVEMDLVPVTE